MASTGSSRAISWPEVTKPLHKSGMAINEVGQWESDQVGEHENCVVGIWFSSADTLQGKKCYYQI